MRTTSNSLNIRMAAPSVPPPARQLRSVAGCYQSPWARVQDHSWRRVTSSGRGVTVTGRLSALASRPPVLRRRGVLLRDPALQRLEAILFLAREPLTGRKLSQFANLADATEARTLIRRLNQFYDRAGRAFRVEELAGGFQLLSRPEFATWLRRLGHVPAEVRLSAPALETLAVIAYRQPVPRADIEAIRGVNCGEILRQLMERDLVRIAGRSEDLGRPYLYGTTKRFLQMFGLLNLNQLPRAAALRTPVPSAAGDSVSSNSVPMNTVSTNSASESCAIPLSQASESRNLLEQ